MRDAQFQFNLTVHAADAAFFGAALGLASFVTVLPLFVSTMTNSAILIGLVAVMHPLGWHLPQLLTAKYVAGLGRLMPTVLLATLTERIPFFLLAAIAWNAHRLSTEMTLALTFASIAAIGLGGGLTATAFQSLVTKIVPRRRRGGFYGVKTAAANLGLALGAIAAGRILTAVEGSSGFAISFLLAGLATVASWLFLALTREEAIDVRERPQAKGSFRRSLAAIVLEDSAFRWYLAVRIVCQVATMGTAFYSVYATREHGLSVADVGLMTALFAGAQVVGNPLLGAAGDRIGHRAVMAVGLACSGAGSLLALSASSVAEFGAVYLLAGVGNVSAWTIPLAMILEFGRAEQRPAYIGLANTIVAPSFLIAPLLGGWLAETQGFETTFAASAVGAALVIIILATRLHLPEGED